MHFTQEQYFELIRFSLYPLFVWIIKMMFNGLLEKVQESVDGRAGKVADLRDVELKGALQKEIGEIRGEMQKLEERDQERHNEVMDLMQQRHNEILVLVRSLTHGPVTN